MSKVVLRPRFRYLVPKPKDEVCKHLRQVLKNNPKGFTGHALDYHAVIDYPDDKRHYWSPQIDFSIDEHERGTLIRGLVGPRPAVWTVFAFFYGIALLAAIGGIIIGFGQWSMGESPVMLWLVPAAAILAGITWVIGMTGKKIAREETVEIHEFLIETLENPEEIELDEI